MLTTNYDDWYLWSAAKTSLGQSDRPGSNEPRPPVLLGRRPEHCRRVLYSLRASHPPIVWALQGFVGGQHPSRDPDHAHDKRLTDELVVGHEEYRRVTYNSTHFRRAFGEVFRHRSFLFLGTGLSDPYLQELFGEILELSGPNPEPHFAFAIRGELDRHFMASRFNILVAEFEHFDDLPVWIDAVCNRITEARPRALEWAYGVHSPLRVEGAPPFRIRVSRTELPALSASGCFAVSAGVSIDQPAVGSGMQRWLARNLSGGTAFGPTERLGKYVRRFKDDPVYLVVARRPEEVGRDARDVRAVFEATKELLELASASGHDVIHAQLLSAGKHRTFPSIVSFIQMLRGYADWARRRHVTDVPELILHVVDPSVLAAISANLINIVELLTCVDLRFWVELLRQDGEVERHQLFREPTTEVCTLLDDLDIPDSGWTFDLHPNPTVTWARQDVSELRGSDLQTLQALGVLPGSLIQLIELPR